MSRQKLLGRVLVLSLTMVNIGYGLFAWAATKEACRGSGGSAYWGSRMCESGALYAVAFGVLQFVLMGIFLERINASQTQRGYAVALGVYSLYTLGILLFAVELWRIPWFVEPPPGYRILPAL